MSATCSVLCLLVVAASSEPISTIYNTCPSKLKYRSDFLQVHNGTCFYFAVHIWNNFFDANFDCLKNRGGLALPKTKALNDYLTDQLLNHYNIKEEVWIGLHDQTTEGRFQWLDRTQPEWTNFASGNGPDNGWLTSRLEDCVALDPLDDGMWHDFQCEDNFFAVMSDSQPRKMYICQF